MVVSFDHLSDFVDVLLHFFDVLDCVVDEVGLFLLELSVVIVLLFLGVSVLTVSIHLSYIMDRINMTIIQVWFRPWSTRHHTTTYSE